MSECNHDWKWDEQTQPSRGFYVFVCSLCGESTQEDHSEDDPV